MNTTEAKRLPLSAILAQLGYDAVARCLAENGHRPARGVLAALLELGAGGQALDDDVTVVVIRRMVEVSD